MAISACRTRGWKIWGGHLCLPGGDCYRVVPAPLPLYRAWRAVLQVARPLCTPRLVVVESAGGHGGLYFGGVVVVGLEDIANIASRMSGYFRELGPREAEIQSWLNPGSLISDADLYHAASVLLLAHELGHAMRDQWDTSSHGPHEEMAADNIAGQIARVLQTDAGIDWTFFHSIGCSTAPHCSHPSSDDRVASYEAGRFRVRTA